MDLVNANPHNLSLIKLSLKTTKDNASVSVSNFMAVWTGQGCSLSDLKVSSFVEGCADGMGLRRCLSNVNVSNFVTFLS